MPHTGSAQCDRVYLRAQERNLQFRDENIPAVRAKITAKDWHLRIFEQGGQAKVSGTATFFLRYFIKDVLAFAWSRDDGMWTKDIETSFQEMVADFIELTAEWGVQLYTTPE